ncbi:hypothetical protein ACQVWH_19355 [Bacillus toyonensis]|uniref:hypothetical protein n=1 Tax=Bacillus toyonensis TaxID=155322 RepID=UPI00027968C6|nr:hypothetical protein [Bacillus toyonensis]KNH39610.1 hypothetical protein ACS75_15680 [Bacillus thuringiensis]EJQ89460.1 hypothetical protein IGO_01956 [Bacillus toyonensis]EOP43505.1 hypothetical protein IKI_01395 [Bacillus toyonensis]HDR7224158.1 hypothetical protein [Bacillus toyonensis]HDR7349045.1 hypothetical protein [Bacillus toyonensis]
MTNKICKLYRLERREVFMKIIDEMKKSGWQQLNANAPSKDKIYVMYSSGNDGMKNHSLELRPFDYVTASSQDIIAGIYRDYDIRDPAKYATDATFRLIERYDKEKDLTFGGPGPFYPLCFHQGKTTNSTTVTTISKPIAMVDLYLYVDKDIVIYCVYENDDNLPERKGKTAIGLFGIPDELYQQEQFTPISSPFSVLVSACSKWSPGTALVTARSKLIYDGLGNIPVNTFIWDKVFLKAPSLEGNIIFTSFFMGDNVDGLRAKFDGLYTYRGSNFVTGDIVEISQDGEVQKYKLFNTYYSSVFSSFPEFNIALRVE